MQLEETVVVAMAVANKTVVIHNKIMDQIMVAVAMIVIMEVAVVIIMQVAAIVVTAMEAVIVAVVTIIALTETVAVMVVVIGAVQAMGEVTEEEVDIQEVETGVVMVVETALDTIEMVGIEMEDMGKNYLYILLTRFIWTNVLPIFMFYN